MAIHRRAAKRDTAERIIIDALEAYGFSVEQVSRKGCGDLLLGKHGITRVVEVKTGKKPLNADQREWWAAWRGNPCIVLRSTEDVATLSKYWTVADRNILRLLAA